MFIALCIATLWVNEGWLGLVRVGVYSPRGRGFNGHVSEVPLPSNIISDALRVNPLPSPARPHEFTATQLGTSRNTTAGEYNHLRDEHVSL